LKSLAVAKFGGSLIDFSGTNIPAIVKCLSNMKAAKDVGPLAVFSAPKGVTDKLQAIGEAKAASSRYDLDSVFTQFSKLSARYVREALLKEFRSALRECRRDVEEALVKVDKRFDGSARAKILTSGGELPTSILMSYVLRSHGVESCYLRKTDWALVTDDDFENATLDFERSRTRLPPLLDYLEEGNVVSVAGFLGITHDGLETLLGRGGSDQTAVFLSCLLRDYYDLETVLLKDTPVQSADPAIVKDQTLQNIPVMTYNEASKATISGMTIIQNAAVRLAMSQTLRMKVAPLKDLSLATIIQAEDPTSYTVKCVTGLRDCAIVTMNNDRSRSFEDCLRLWEGYEGFLDLGAELMETGQVIRDFLILDANFVRRHEEQLKTFDKEMNVEYGLGIVALIGDKMRNSPGVASISIGAIPDINIKRGVFAPHTSQIILVLNEQDVPETIRRIHTQLNKVNKT
jgi:aspartate kinase